MRERDLTLAELTVVEAHRHLSELLVHMAPQCEPLPDLLGLCTQIDNLLTALGPRGPVVVAGWRRRLERLCLRGLEVARGGPARMDIVSEIAALAPPAPVETWRDEGTGEVVVLAGTRWLRVRQ